MGRFKITKQDTFIDMTPMSDVMVLLLTFFMLTATFVKEEPVKVNAPGSVSEVKIPTSKLLTIFVEKNGKVFLNLDTPGAMRRVAQQVNQDQNAEVISDINEFAQVPMFGTPLDQVNAWLRLDDRNGYLAKNPNAGVPCDSVNDELKVWVRAAVEALGEDSIRIAIKADKTTPYKNVKYVINSLRSEHQNRYNLITSLSGAED
ncbi:MAG: biopolymer transporter ExbD [Alloprevotella sp.]|nr:biopolymer transporter ExbD [Bacteroidales bacterium]MDY2605019.1 biopolymer transporter ExbD [Alloprevotella sp.]MCI6104044.1 biopolymer transporter ExbD [Bacteroidales bacterium]MCI6252356.1 biopolymer transporter ExbD [Bacteroidales bacterium]MCI7645544.1 biopolymer transporter ExbD [Bacteroidales bacterium]